MESLLQPGLRALTKDSPRQEESLFRSQHATWTPDRSVAAATAVKERLDEGQYAHSYFRLLKGIPPLAHAFIAAVMVGVMMYLDSSRTGLSIFYFIPSVYVFATLRGGLAIVLHSAITIALFATLPIMSPDRVTLQGTFNRVLGVGMAVCVGQLLRERRRVERQLHCANEALESRIAESSAELKETVRLLSQSEEQFRLFMRQLPGLAWIKDLEGKYLYANDATLGFFNLSPERLYGRTDQELLPAAIAAQFIEADQRAIERGSDTAIVECPKEKTSTQQWALVNRFPLPDPQSDRCLVGGIAIDITERKLAEEKVRKSGRFRETIIRTAAEGICVSHLATAGPQVQFSVWNDRMTEITGYTMEEINQLGWHQTMYPDPELRERAKKRMELTRQGVELRSEEWEITRKDGAKRTVAISTSITEDESNGPSIIALMQDITERKQAESNRRKLENQVQRTQKLEGLGVLAGGIAHDFNNLLTAILGNAGLAKAHVASKSPAESMLGEIEEAAHRAAELTQQLLAYSGKGKLDVQITRLDELVRNMIALLSTVVSKKASMELDLQPALFKGDATQMRQVVMNLMINASDALEGSAGKVQVRTGIRSVAAEELRSPYIADELPGGEYAFVQIDDSGCGMTEELKARIFDPFFTTKFAGRGLGLAAVLGIVRSHRGTIHVQSAPGQGARFEVLLPTCHEAAAPEVAARGIFPAIHGQGAILVIDDELMVRDFARRALESVGFEVFTANDGEAGVRQFEQNPRRFAAVLLDLTMPSMDGFEVLRKIKALAPLTPVVLMSGYDEQELLKDHDRANGFLQKPFEPQLLYTRLSDLLSAH